MLAGAATRSVETSGALQKEKAAVRSDRSKLWRADGRLFT